MSYKSLPAITAEEYIIPNVPLEATCHNNKVMHGGSTVSLLNKKKKKQLSCSNVLPREWRSLMEEGMYFRETI